MKRKITLFLFLLLIPGFLLTGQNQTLPVQADSGLQVTRPITTPWHWLSFPRLQRTGNNPVEAISVLEDLNPIPDNLYFHSNEGGYFQYIERSSGWWQPTSFNEITTTKGYKQNILDEGTFTHTMYGTDLNPNTPVPLYVSQNGNPENWIGYFLHQPLMPEEAFQGVWESLTQIKSQYWTMTKVIVNGKPVWLRPSNVAPIRYGDALVVKVSDDCTLYWNQSGEPAGESQRAAPEYFDYTEYADYQPWYIGTDSLQGAMEIGLMAEGVCIGAATLQPGDTLLGVNAYTQAAPPGTPVTIAVWDGLKSTSTITDKYYVISPETNSRQYRTVHTGEGQPYYYISLTGGQAQNTLTQPANLTGISPNPCTAAAVIGFNMAKAAHACIEITGINGKQISTIISGQYPEGSYKVTWKTTDAHGRYVENGIYVVTLRVDGTPVENQKVVVIN